MSMGPYTSLFRIEIEHGFFPGGECRHLEFVPTPQTQRAITNTGMLVSYSENSVQVFCDGRDLDSLRLYATDTEEPLSLIFKASSQDPSFGIYTEPDVSAGDSILYFDNQRGSIDDTGEGPARFRLTIGEMVSESDFELLGSPLLTGVLDARDALVKPIFVANIHISEADLALDSATSMPVSTSYYLRFNNRQTFWKYYLQGDLAREGLQITDLDNQVEFEFLGQTSLSNRINAGVYRSQTPLSLRERTDYRFQLRENNSGNGRVLIRRLPVASASQLSQDIRDEALVPVSEIFVTC